MKLFAVVLVLNLQLCLGGPITWLTNTLVRSLERDISPARSALKELSTFAADMDIQKIIQKRQSSPIQLETSNQNDITELPPGCQNMTATLHDVLTQAKDFEQFVIHATLKVAPYLQEVVNCEVKNPMMWLHCAYSRCKTALHVVKMMRPDIQKHINAFKQLKIELMQEYRICAVV